MNARTGWLSGGGEMGERIRAFNWASTPLGPPEDWPQALKSAVTFCLGSAFPIVIWWDRKHTIQLYNDAYISFLGTGKHPAFLGRSGSECWAEIWGTMGPLWERVFETGTPSWFEDFHYAINRRLPLEEGYFTFSYNPIHGATGTVDGIFCACYETTAKVVGARRLETLRRLGDQVIEAGSVADACEKAAAVLSENQHDIPYVRIDCMDRDGNLPSDIIAPEALGVVLQTQQPSDVSGLELSGGAWPEPATQAVALPLLSPTQRKLAGLILLGVSPRRPLDAEYRTFFDLIAGQVSAAVASARAREEERERAEALAEIDRAKTAFFSNVSHEFRTPLSLILGPLEDALSEPEAHVTRDHLEALHRNALRLQRLVNTLLEFARIEAGRIDASYEPTDIGTFTAELASVFRSAVERAGLRLIIDAPPSAEPAYVDREMWEKIVLNLVSNAFKFTFEGNIEVSLHLIDSRFELVVRDTGVGIPESEQPRMFERFHRVKQSRSRTYEGTGIGLALVQELVKLHGGDVSLWSEEGAGTALTVRIPRGSAHLPSDRIQSPREHAATGLGTRPFIEEALRWLPAERSSAGLDVPPDHAEGLPSFLDALSSRGEQPSGAPLRSPKGRVLIADDNADMRDYLERLLGARYDVETVADGEAALERVRADRPDLVVADVMMPRVDGFGLVAAIRGDPRARSLPVLLLSARAGEESRIEGLEAGADAYLVKPFSSRELLAAVGSLLELSRARAETEEALRRHDRDKDQFLAMLGHELRNPIGVLASAVHVLQHPERSQEDAARARDAMTRQLHHLGRLVDDLLDVSRVTAAKIRLERKPLDLARSVESTLHTLRTTGALDRHQVTFVGETVWVDADETRIEQILTNLVGNAMKFTPPNGRVAVTVRSEGPDAVIRVKDEGAGIHPEALATIFELFAQGTRTLDRRQGGLGIGLTLVQSLVELHGGSVRAESDGAGKGSLFTVSLPSIPAPFAPEESPRVAERSDRKLRVLVVEDNKDAREMLQASLELEGHEVHVASTGPEGVEAALRLLPDVAIIDLGLPELDGYGVVRAIRAAPAGAGLRLIALTGYGQLEDRQRAIEAGFDAHVAKPIDPGALSSLILSLRSRTPA